MLLQRATQAYMDFFPALSVYGIVKGQIRDFGFKTSSDVGVYATFMDPTELMLTGDDATPPGGVSATELQAFVESLIQRLTAMAYPD